MIGTGALRDLRGAAAREVQRLRDFDWKAYAADAVDGAVRGIMAGLSARELRAILRGDTPTEKPNPRYKAQVKSFLLHLRPSIISAPAPGSPTPGGWAGSASTSSSSRRSPASSSWFFTPRRPSGPTATC
jgi:hypothetical protein